MYEWKEGYFTCQTCGKRHRRWRTHYRHVMSHNKDGVVVTRAGVLSEQNK